MKSIRVFFVILFVSNSAIGQQLGLNTGLNLSNIGNGEELNPGLNIGVVVDSEINKRFGFSGGLYLTQFSYPHLLFTNFSGSSSQSFKLKRRLTAINIPLLFKVNLNSLDYNTTSDIWFFSGVIAGSNIMHNSIVISESTGERTKQSAGIPNRFLLGVRGGFEFSSFNTKKAAYAFGTHFDYYFNELFDVENFYAIGLYFKASLLFDNGE